MTEGAAGGMVRAATPPSKKERNERGHSEDV